MCPYVRAEYILGISIRQFIYPFSQLKYFRRRNVLMCSNLCWTFWSWIYCWRSDILNCSRKPWGIPWLHCLKSSTKHEGDVTLTLSQWSSSGNPMAIQCAWNLDPSVHWNATGERIVGSQCVSSVLPVVFQWLSSGLPECSNYAN